MRFVHSLKAKVASKNIQQKNLVGLQNQAHRIAFQYCVLLCSISLPGLSLESLRLYKSLSKNISFPSKGNLGAYFLTWSERKWNPREGRILGHSANKHNAKKYRPKSFGSGYISDLDTALRNISDARVELYELFHTMYATLVVSHKYPIVGKQVVVTPFYVKCYHNNNRIQNFLTLTLGAFNSTTSSVTHPQFLSFICNKHDKKQPLTKFKTDFVESVQSHGEFLKN